MTPTTKKQWFALYTRPRWEKKVADQLERKKITAYCPTNKTKRQWADRRKINYEPLFTSYVFVYASLEEHARIKEVDGVINFVFWLNKPAVVRNEEIDTIKKFLLEYENVRLERALVDLSDRVRVINGPLMMWEGNVVEIRTNTVKISLPSLGYMLVAEIKESSLETIDSMEELQTRAV